jgi:hypothetical protein
MQSSSMQADRNHFGSQMQSFEAQLDCPEVSHAHAIKTPPFSLCSAFFLFFASSSSFLLYLFIYLFSYMFLKPKKLAHL